MKKPTEMIVCNLRISVQKNFYDGLWYIRYDDGGHWAGPFKTKKEACERLEKEGD